MNMCLRPCQEVVGPAEYGHEVARVTDFLRSGGESLLSAIAHSRDRLSEQMQFEEAARQHKRFEKVEEVLKLRDELARDVEGLHGVAVTRSLARDAVELWFVRGGLWQQPRRFSFEVRRASRSRSIGRCAKRCDGGTARSRRERQEYLALLARWYYSSWRRARAGVRGGRYSVPQTGARDFARGASRTPPA
jgi:excinuclease UvrABC nuclease subunit